MSALRNRQGGFTIIELMIATLVFSTILLLCTIGLISIGRMYQKGNTSRVTQEITRNAMDQIKNDFELSGGQYVRLTAASGVEGFCIGDNLYSYQLHVVDAFRVTQAAGCTSGSVSPTLSGGRTLLGPNMRLAELTLAPDAVVPPTAMRIKINVVAGDSDLLVNAGTPQAGCKGGAGQEYCAGSVLETYATRRLQ